MLYVYMYIYMYICISNHPNETCSTLEAWQLGHGEVCTSAFKDGPKRTDWAPEEPQLAPSLDSVHS
jgi:hypothetical protein